MTGLPTTQVLLDNFTGAFPYDITQYVRLTEPSTWSRGRSDELAQIQPGVLTLTLENIDGRFSQGSATYGVSPDQNIRIIRNGVTRWTGSVQNWPVEWPGGDDTYSTVKVSAVDTLARFSRKKLRSAAQEEIVRTIGSGGYYPFSEASGATQAADFSGNDYPPFTVDPSNRPTWGVDLEVVDHSTGANISAGPFLGYVALGSPWTSSNLSFDLVINGNVSSITLLSVGMTTPGDGARLTLTSAGVLTFAGFGTITGTVSYTSLGLVDGKGHVVSLQVDGVAAVMWVDGAIVATSVTAGFTGTWSGATIGLCTFLGAVGSMTIGQFNYTARIADADVARHHAAILSDLNGETPQARIARVCGYVGQATGSLDTLGSTLMGPANQSGKTLMDVFNEVADATLGFVYADAAGTISSVNGQTMVGSTTPDLSVDAAFLAEDLVVPYDMFGVANIVTGKAEFSENVTIAQNAFSRAFHGDYPADLSWNVSTDAQAADRTRWFVNNFGGADSRYPSLTIDLLTLDATSVAAALTLDLGKFVHLTGMPSQNPRGGGVVDLIVQGITETVTKDEWTLTLTCSRHSLVEAWILGDPVHGILGATTKLYV